MEIPVHRWKADRTGAFVARRDHRSLLVIEHPWKPSRKGCSGQWEAEVGPPADWRPGDQLFVSFYQSDNYCGAWSESDWMGTQAFVGHRFKQLLVNGEVVWEEDVADEEMTDPRQSQSNASAAAPGYLDPYRIVDITKHVGPKMRMTFRVVDRVASATELPGDTYRRFWWSAYDPNEVAKNFQTSAYFGEVYLSSGPDIVRPETEPPSVRKPAISRTSLPKAGIPLSLIVPGSLPAPGYPVRCGVPLPEGTVPAGLAFCLKDAKGAKVPAGVSETSHWPDGSVRWVLCEFVATRKGRYRLVPGLAPLRPAKPVRIRKDRKSVTISNGELKLRIDRRPGAGVWREVGCASAIDLGAMDLSLKVNRVGWRDHFTARRKRVAVEHSNAVCAVVRVEGDMIDGRKQRYGPWRVRLHVWAGLPYVLADWRLVNESDQSMAVMLDWSAHIGLPGLEESKLDFGPFEPGYDPDDIGVKAMGHYGVIETLRAIPLHGHSELRCVQERANQARIYRNTTWCATSGRAPGFVNVSHPEGGIAASMRWFAEEFPKGIVVRPDLLSLGTLPESRDALGWPHDRPWVRLGRGEAKRQTFAIWLHDGNLPSVQAERFNRCVQDAPHLFTDSWFLSSGVLEAGPPRRDRKLEKWANRVTPVIERTGIGAPRLGHREYWDTCWSNDYRGRAHLGLLQYFETGDPEWFRYFDAACNHNRDIDIIHYCPEHPEWIGAIHQYGEDHTSCGPMGNIGLNCDSMLDHYLMTGDPDSLDAAKGLAEHVMKCPPYSRSARAVGWPLAQVVRWYEQTGERRYLRKAQELVKAAIAYVEPRRGIFNEMHGNWNYRGIVPFMTGYLAFGLIRYHRLTGDPEVLRLLSLLADGLFTEGHVGKGRFCYSPFPENNRSVDGCRAWNGLIGGLTGYLYLVTGRDTYAKWTQECYDAIVKDAGNMQVTMDMLQTAGWMLRAVAGR